MNNNYDIVIIGGGLVGLSLACALGELPLRIAIVEALPEEKRLSKQSDLRSIALSCASQRIYTTLGVWSAMSEYAAPIEQIHVSERGCFAIARLIAEQANVSALAYVVPFQRLNEILNHRVSTDNVTWFCPAQLQSIALQEDGQHEVTVLIAGKQQTLHTQLLVAADGSNSSVGRLANIEQDIWDYRQSAVVTNIDLARSHGNIAYERFTKKGAMALLPIAAQRCALIWSMPGEEAAQYSSFSEQEFLAQLQYCFGYRLGRFLHISKRHVYPIKLITSKQVYQTGLVLIGNAAHTLHPIAGQGFNLSLRDVAVLAQVIRDACKSKQPLGSLAALHCYQQLRNDDQKTMIRLTDHLMRLFACELWPLTQLRRSGLMVMDRVKLLKHYFLEPMLGLAGRIPDLACGIPINIEKL